MRRDHHCTSVHNKFDLVFAFKLEHISYDVAQNVTSGKGLRRRTELDMSELDC